MRIFDYSLDKYINVHPCFLYESLWCVLGFVLLHIYSKRRKFNGELFLMYVMWYGFGRFFIEGLRTDSLMIGQTIRVSQVVAAVTFIVALILYIYKRLKLKEAALEPTYNSVYGDAAKALSEEEAQLDALQHIDGTDDEEDEEDEDDDEEYFVDDEDKEELKSTDDNNADGGEKDK